LAVLGLTAAVPDVSFAQSAPIVEQAAPPVSPFAQIPGVNVKYYDVSGATIKDIRASIEAQRPKNPVTQQAIPSSSNWSMRASWQKQTTGSACKIISATAAFEGEVVLPRLIAVEGVAVPPPVMKEWQRYTTSLDQQQAGVLRQVYDRRAEVERAVMASSCEGAAKAADAAITAIRQSIVPAAPSPAVTPAAPPKG
jgi:predicted secreted Zn-dependent protease